MANTRSRAPLVWGAVLILIGALFLLYNINFDVWDFVARLWPLILVVWGAWKLFFGLKELSDKK